MNEEINEELKKEIKEQIDITINETDVHNVRDIRFTLNTGFDSSTMSHITEHISGVLDAIIIEAEKTVDIRISLNEHPEIILFESNFSGSKYLPLQQEPISHDNKKLNFGTVKWTINDSLKINISNNFNAIVHFTIRYR